MGHCALRSEPCYYHYYSQASNNYYYEHDNICGMIMNAMYLTCFEIEVLIAGMQ